MSPTEYRGPSGRLVNTAALRKGSIHDDAAAQALGFRGAFVPGSVVGTRALEAATALLGEAWLDSGSYRMTFVTPVYSGDDVHAAGESVSTGAEMRVETGEGRLCCSGVAGGGYSLPWDPGADWSRGAVDVMPAIERGFAFGEMAFEVTPAEVSQLVAASGAGTQAFMPEGGLVPPEHLQKVALDLVRTKRLGVEGVRDPGMWAEHCLAYREPLRTGIGYRMVEQVVDKGRSGRTIFLTYEFGVENARGDEVARGRHKVKWLAADR